MIDDRPRLTFDYAQQGNLIEILLTQAQEALAMAGKSQRALVERYRGLLGNRGSDATFVQVLRIVHDYVRISPLDFQEMVRVLGGLDQAVRYLPGVEPPPVVWNTLNRLRSEGAKDKLVQEFWYKIISLIESGEENEWVYGMVCLDYTYDKRGLKPGYKISTSKALVRA